MCEVCNDAGYVRLNLEPSHPLFGRLFPCQSCGGGNHDGFGQDEYGLLPSDRLLLWENILAYNQSIVEAIGAVKATVLDGYGWVYLWGGYGSAKTAILKTAVADCLRRIGQEAVYLRMADLMDEIRAAYDARSPQVEAQKRIRYFSRLPVLAIDEAEKVNDTGFVEERRFQVLDTRYEAATRQKYGITLMAGNVPPEKLDGAIASRIRDGRFRVVHITSNDFRPSAAEFFG